MSSVEPSAVASTPDDAELYARHGAELVRFASVLVGPSGADDLVADTVVRVFAHPTWRHVDNRRAYLFRAVLNAAREHDRSSARRRRREQLAAPREAVADPTGAVRPEVLAAMRALDPRQRAIVFFTYWQDRDTAEIADELGITTRTVQRELADARRHLQELLR